MRRATLALVNLLFLPSGSLDTYLKAARKANRWDLDKCGLLALSVLLLLKDGALLYAVWLCTVILCGRPTADLAQTLRSPQLTEPHGHKLAPTRETVFILVGFMLAYERLELGARKQLQ